MQKFILFFVALFLYMTDSFSQQLPFGTCGIVNVYDAAGNRTKRVYFCNNGDPYPQRNQQAGDYRETYPGDKNETSEFQYVDALYPNPTTGSFVVTFSKSLQNASVSITDNNGKTLARFKASGNKVDFDLSKYAAGVYYIKIEEGGKTITKKVVKQ